MPSPGSACLSFGLFLSLTIWPHIWILPCHPWHRATRQIKARGRRWATMSRWWCDAGLSTRKRKWWDTNWPSLWMRCEGPLRWTNMKRPMSHPRHSHLTQSLALKANSLMSTIWQQGPLWILYWKVTMVCEGVILVSCCQSLVTKSPSFRSHNLA